MKIKCPHCKGDIHLVGQEKENMREEILALVILVVFMLFLIWL